MAIVQEPHSTRDPHSLVCNKGHINKGHIKRSVGGCISLR